MSIDMTKSKDILKAIKKANDDLIKEKPYLEKKENVTLDFEQLEKICQRPLKEMKSNALSNEPNWNLESNVFKF